MSEELLKILLIGQELIGADRPTSYLLNRSGVSPATVKRYVAELRHLGCEIVSRRTADGWTYRLENPDQVQARLLRWIELERTQDLREVV